MRHISEAGLKLIMQSEGCRLKAYRNFPNEPWTIGYGSTIWLDGKPVRQGQVCTSAQAEQLLKRDIVRFERCVNAHLARAVETTNPAGEKVSVPMPQSVFDGQVSLAYNIGEAAWLKSSQLKNLNSGAYIKWKEIK